MPSTGTRPFLLFSAAVWLPYGLYCFATPSALAPIAGVAATTATGTVELRAMYGGLQTAIGVLALLGAVRGSLTRTALVTLGTLALGLGSARLFGVFVDGHFTAYTGMGLGFEWFTVLASRYLLRRK